MRLLVKLAERYAGFYPRATRLRIDTNRAHRRQVDQEPTLANCVSGDVVATAAHRQEQSIVAGQAHGAHHVTGTVAAHHSGWPPVDHRVPDRPRFVISGFVGQT